MTMHFPKKLKTSKIFDDGYYEYISYFLTQEQYEKIKKLKVVTNQDFESIDIVLEKGWEQYYFFRHEPNIFHFRRPLGTDVSTGEVPKHILEKIAVLREKQKKEKDEYLKYIENTFDTEETEHFSLENAKLDY